MEVVGGERKPRPLGPRRRSIRLPLRLRWILIVALLPLELVGIFALAMRAYEVVRYDSAYFTPVYQERYSSPTAVVRALEGALQQGDRARLAELQGLRWPARTRTGPAIRFVKLLERTDRYLAYLYVDMQSYERYPHYVEQVRGRWVVAPMDLYFYLHSGQWLRHFFPLSIAWWVLGALALGFVWLLRTSERARAWLLGDGE